MTSVVRTELLALFDHVVGRTLDRLAGLTDDEYGWGPVPGCWHVRADGLDGEGVVTDTPPVTTLGWRLCHISDGLARHPMNGFLRPGFVASPRRFPLTAEEGAAHFRRSAEEWRDLLGGTDDETLLSPLGPAAGPYADATRLGLVLHIADELIHHTAEIALVRDLYANRPA